ANVIQRGIRQRGVAPPLQVAAVEELIEAAERVVQKERNPELSPGSAKRICVEVDVRAQAGGPRSFTAVLRRGRAELVCEATSHGGRCACEQRTRVGGELCIRGGRRIEHERAVVGESVAVDVAPDHRRERCSRAYLTVQRDADVLEADTGLKQERMTIVEVTPRPAAVGRRAERRSIESALELPRVGEGVRERSVEP